MKKRTFTLGRSEHEEEGFSWKEDVEDMRKGKKRHEEQHGKGKGIGEQERKGSQDDHEGKHNHSPLSFLIIATPTSCSLFRLRHLMLHRRRSQFLPTLYTGFALSFRLDGTCWTLDGTLGLLLLSFDGVVVVGHRGCELVY